MHIGITSFYLLRTTYAGLWFISQIITRHRKAPINQPIHAYQNHSFSHTHKNMTPLEVWHSLACRAQNYAFQLVADHSKPMLATPPPHYQNWGSRSARKFAQAADQPPLPLTSSVHQLSCRTPRKANRADNSVEQMKVSERLTSDLLLHEVLRWSTYLSLNLLS